MDGLFEQEFLGHINSIVFCSPVTGESCPKEIALGLHWKKTAVGGYDTNPCPRRALGHVKRKCEAEMLWLMPDFSECISLDYEDLHDKSKLLSYGGDTSKLITKLEHLTTQTIDNSMIFGGNLLMTTQIISTIVKKNEKTDDDSVKRKEVMNFVKTCSNLLDDTNKGEWRHVQRRSNGSADLLYSLGQFGLQAARRLSYEDMTEPIVTSNIVMSMERRRRGTGDLTFPDYSDPKIRDWDAKRDFIILPKNVFERAPLSIASFVYKTLQFVLPAGERKNASRLVMSSPVKPNSRVVATVVYPPIRSRLDPPVTIILTHLKVRKSKPKCVFWDFKKNQEQGGDWSSEGCQVVHTNETQTQCSCDHLSNFAILMDINADQEVLAKEERRERKMVLMWMGVPVLAITVIGALYTAFTWTRKEQEAVQEDKSTKPAQGQQVVHPQPYAPFDKLYRFMYPPTKDCVEMEWQDEFASFIEYDVDSRCFRKIGPFRDTHTTPFGTQYCEQYLQSILQRSIIKRKTKVTFEENNNNEEKQRSRRTEEERQRFERLKKVERRVFGTPLKRWQSTQFLYIPESPGSRINQVVRWRHYPTRLIRRFPIKVRQGVSSKGG